MNETIRFLKTKNISVKVVWVQREFDLLEQRQKNDANSVILCRILDVDWTNPQKNVKEMLEKSLPEKLDRVIFNKTLITINGNFVLQIVGILDISRAFMNPVEEELDEMDQEADDGNELASLMKGKKALASNKKPKKTWVNGKRCLQIILFDGYQECKAIEFSTVPDLHENLLGAKVLLKGPLEVSCGIVMLRASNIQILSKKTFYPISTQNSNNPNPSSNDFQEEIPEFILRSENDYESLLLDDDLDDLL